ncbi:Hypp4908 [Branchiostoma lanceolatum]|uniref:Hypp4908 protein n=1 Tax=Branchiostoma lanceolatum TaxID=7740 RepID=A0A8K0ADC4_BRALA|nr:Hypp4908 [Branchiostoma lanceolatum]
MSSPVTKNAAVFMKSLRENFPTYHKYEAVGQGVDDDDDDVFNEYEPGRAVSSPLTGQSITGNTSPRGFWKNFSFADKMKRAKKLSRSSDSL